MAEHQTTETPGESKGMVDINALPADIREQLLAAQKSLKETTAPNTPKIGVKEGGGRYRLGDDTFKELTGIIVAVRHANKWFDKDYTPGQANPAECVVTVPLPGTDMVNSKLVTLPVVCNPQCTICMY